MGGRNGKATSQELQSFDLEDGEGGDDLMDGQFPWLKKNLKNISGI